MTNSRALGSGAPRAYDRCDTCGRLLRDPASRAAGRGPVCRRKYDPPAPRSSTGPAPPPAAPGDDDAELPEPADQLTLWSAPQ